MSFHDKQKRFVKSPRLTGKFSEYISDGYTCILQSCNVGVMKAFICGIKINTWRGHRQKISPNNSCGKLPVPTQKIWSISYSIRGAAFLKFVFKKKLNTCVLHIQQFHLHQPSIPPLVSYISVITCRSLVEMKIQYIYNKLFLGTTRWLYFDVGLFSAYKKLE